MSFLDRIAACNRGDPDRYPPFRVGGSRVGRVRPDVAPVLADFPAVFVVSDGAVDLHPNLTSPRERTAAVDGVLRQIAARGLVAGWRDEAYPVVTGFTAPPLMEMERAAVPLFGVRAYGIHVNGYVVEGDTMHMWVARRSPGKQTAPGKLDQMVGGGQPAGLSLGENLIKECAEEASIAEALAVQARPAGCVTYVGERPEGLRDDVLFVYDLRLPADFTPVNADGEVEDFRLWPLDRVLESVRETEDFKFNCAVVVIDFLVRHGVIPPDHPDYEAIVVGMHR